MVKILGIDPSLTGTGIAIVTKGPKGNVLWHNLQVLTSKLKGHERFTYICNEILKVCGKLSDGDIIVMEGPSFGSGGAKSHELAGGWWLTKHTIYNWLLESGIQLKAFYVIPPRSRAKYATGNGNAKKDGVLKAVNEQTKLNITDHNIADAVVLATMGARLGFVAVDDIPAEELHRVTPLANVKNQLENGLSGF